MTIAYNRAIELVNVAAGAAANGTTYHQLDVRNAESANFELLFTPDTGSITATVYATLNTDDTVADDSTDWVDVTNDMYGSASFTSSQMLNDAAGYTRGVARYMIKLVVADKTDNTAYKILSLVKRNGTY